MAGLLSLDGVTKSFGGVTAVKGLSLSVDEGEIVGIIGPNGAGKTTVFNLIAGIYKPNAGRIIFQGTLINGKNPFQICKLGIARTFQTVRPFPKMTAIDNVIVGALFGRARISSPSSSREYCEKILQVVGLYQKRDRLARELTLAEQRKLELARALATRPQLLMLDELMAGLTSAEISEELEIIRMLRAEHKITVMLIEHVMRAVMQICERVIVLDHGVRIAEGTPAQIASDPLVIKAYMGERIKTGNKPEETTSADQESEASES